MSAPLNLLLDSLDNPREYGQGYRAVCPAHEGKSKSALSVKETDDGRVLLHCFAGCSALDVMHSLGLELKDLFERPPANMTDEEKRRLRQLAKQGQLKAVLELIPLEIAVVEIAGVRLAKGKPLNESDHLRLELAGKRISSAKAVLCGH
jgi:hypothetical protein